MYTIIKTGSTLPQVAEQHGDFETWFAERLGAKEAEVNVIAVHSGAALPRVADCKAVLVTGSSAMVTDRPPWSVRTGEWLAELIDAKVPLLAVCYGHQLLADALGGVVAKNPNGREIGTIDVELTAEGNQDSLLGGIGDPLRVQATHLESVVELPGSAVRLGGSVLDPNQCYRVGSHAWAVQFHPEFSSAVVRGYIERRAAQILAEGLDPDSLRDRVADSDHGRIILERFAAITREI